MATRYDPSVIQTFADGLYTQADRIVYQYAFVGFVFGGGITAAIAIGENASAFFPGLIVGLIVAALAASAGRARGFALRLQAQTALCQVQIEFNSRKVTQ